MQFKFRVWFVAFLMLFFAVQLNLQASTRIWQQANNPANKVAIEEAKDLGAFNHPYEVDPKKLTDMFLSLRFNKQVLFLEDIKDRQVFFDADLLENKFMPHIIEAFKRAKPNEVVIISIVQKDPYFIVRNDRLNVIRAYVAQDGLHLEFIKTNAKLVGDYESHNPTGKRLIEGAKGLRVSLEPQEGQKLSMTRPGELILDMNYDFAALVDKKAAEEEQREAEKKNRKRKKNKETTAKRSDTPTTDNTPAKSGSKSSSERLQELKKLKDQGLISPQEYEQKKKEVLKDL